MINHIKFTKFMYSLKYHDIFLYCKLCQQLNVIKLLFHLKLSHLIVLELTIILLMFLHFYLIVLLKGYIGNCAPK